MECNNPPPSPRPASSLSLFSEGAALGHATMAVFWCWFLSDESLGGSGYILVVILLLFCSFVRFVFFFLSGFGLLLSFFGLFHFLEMIRMGVGTYYVPGTAVGIIPRRKSGNVKIIPGINSTVLERPKRLDPPTRMLYISHCS